MKNFFFAAAISAVCMCTVSCSSESLSTEGLDVNKRQNVLYVEEATKTTVAETEGTGSVRQWTLSDGQTVNARYDGSFAVESINIINIDEAVIDDNRITVYVDVEAQSTSGGRMKKSVSYDKIVRASEPDEPSVPDEPIVVPAGPTYRVECDTVMKVRSSLIRMQHRAVLVTTFEDGTEKRDTLASGNFIVCEFSKEELTSEIYSLNGAQNVEVATYLSNASTENSVEGLYSLSKVSGEQKFLISWLSSARSEMKKEHTTPLTMTSISFDYDDEEKGIHVHEKYAFNFSCEEYSSKVERNQNLSDVTESDHLYHYDGDLVKTFKLKVNDQLFGYKDIRTNVFVY